MYQTLYSLFILRKLTKLVRFTKKLAESQLKLFWIQRLKVMIILNFLIDLISLGLFLVWVLGPVDLGLVTKELGTDLVALHGIVLILSNILLRYIQFPTQTHLSKRMAHVIASSS